MQFGADPQQGLSVSRGIQESAVVVQVRGELDYRSAPLLRGELGGVWEIPGISAIILDLSEVTFCDSVGLSELIAVLRRSQNTGHALMVSGLQGTLLRVLTITGLHNAFDSYATVEEALRRASPILDPRMPAPPAIAVPSVLEPPVAPHSPLEPLVTAQSPLEPTMAPASPLEPTMAPASLLEPAAAAAPAFETPSALDRPAAMDLLETTPAAQEPSTMLETPDAGNDLPPGQATPAS
ncbi:anti-sigma factor antagonist [Sphaerisporangium sp. NPDC088356]|uniref:anti-sigma factor antagonist n=1 Tax=Sphaerisporangium sp. NPDC088356 TaxID=3154871 RepID=UPI003415F5C4